MEVVANTPAADNANVGNGELNNDSNPGSGVVVNPNETSGGGNSNLELAGTAGTISWGRWDRSLDENWVVVSRIEDELVRVSTGEYFADVSATPLAGLRGQYSYGAGIASAFIGSGSAGDIDSLVANMAVDFDTGAITAGSLQVLVADQAWALNFDGAINNGMVELNSLGGTLTGAGALISNQIDASLGGAFTGNQAEAFVGGFEMLDELNQFNSVEGIYTIER